MLTHLDPGTLVDIRISDVDRPRYLNIPAPLLTTPGMRIEVTRCAPAEYPPVPGDVWQTVADAEAGSR